MKIYDKNDEVSQITNPNYPEQIYKLTGEHHIYKQTSCRTFNEHIVALKWRHPGHIFLLNDLSRMKFRNWQNCSFTSTNTDVDIFLLWFKYNAGRGFCNSNRKHRLEDGALDALA